MTDTAVVNPVAKDRLRLSLSYGIDYDADLAIAREILIQAARAIENVVERPPPTAEITELGDSAVEVTTRFWLAEPARTDFVRVRSAFHRAILERFEEAGIEMPYPHQELSGELEVANRR